MSLTWQLGWPPAAAGHRPLVHHHSRQPHAGGQHTGLHQLQPKPLLQGLEGGAGHGRPPDVEQLQLGQRNQLRCARCRHPGAHQPQLPQRQGRPDRRQLLLLLLCLLNLLL